MIFIRIKNLCKSFKIGKNNIEAIKDISLELPDHGLIVILGKSGSGKSTLLNLIGGIDKTSSGLIRFEPINKRKNRLKFTSFIFQHYHLFENESGVYNIMLPALIKGQKYEHAEEDALNLLKLFNIPDDIARRTTKTLSGGEKERIAILRALVTDPRLVLADEPTGALDSENAIKTMDLLKRASERRLVIVVTHNKKLAKKYADRIITISNGKIISDITTNENNEEIFRQKDICKPNEKWKWPLIHHNFLRRIRRNVVSTIGMTISLVFCYLLFGFSNKSGQAISETSEHHLDYGSGIIRKEISTPTNSSVSLIKSVMPNEQEIDDIKSKFSSFEILPNFDAIFCSGNFYKNNKIDKEMRASFVYDFSDNCYDKSLIIEGSIPSKYSWNDVIINKKARDLLQNKSLYYAISYEKQFESSIVEFFEIEEKLNIIAVADELDFLSSPKVYFDYRKIEEIFEEKILENLSEKRGKNISWKNVVLDSENDDVSSYSKRIFLRDINQRFEVEKLNNYLTLEIKFESDALSIKEALSSLTLAASMGLDIFLVISLVGSFLILGVFSYSSYVDDKKESSILSCLGARKMDIVEIFASESLIVTFFSFFFATVISFLIQNPINSLLNNLLGIQGLIEIPFSRFAGVKGLLPFGILLCSLLISYVFTALPILINKTISIRKELSDL